MASSAFITLLFSKITYFSNSSIFFLVISWLNFQGVCVLHFSAEFISVIFCSYLVIFSMCFLLYCPVYILCFLYLGVYTFLLIISKF